MMWCMVVTREDFLPHIVQHKVLEKKRFSNIALKGHEKILLLSDWAFSRPLPTPLVWSHSFQCSSSCQVYNTVFHSWSQKVFLFFFSFFPSKRTYTANCFFQVVLGDWQNANYFLTMQKHPLKTWLKIAVSFCLSLNLLSSGCIYGWCPIFGSEIPPPPELNLWSFLEFPTRHSGLRTAKNPTAVALVTVESCVPFLAWHSGLKDQALQQLQAPLEI